MNCRRIVVALAASGALLAGLLLLDVTPIAAQRPQPRAAAAPPSTLLLTNAWLIDGTGGPAVDNAWIRIDGDRIAAVGRQAPLAIPGARVLDLGGRTVYPGLSDMHVHLRGPVQAKWMLKLLLAHGVTRIKETGNTLGNLATIRQWLANEEAAPHVAMSGVIMNGSFEDLRFLDAGARTRALLDDNLAFGVQFLKAYNWDSSRAVRQMSEVAKSHRVPLTGHVPLGMTSVAAIDAGMEILEHVRLRPWEVHDDPEVIARYPIDLSVTRRTGHWAHLDAKADALRRTLDAWAKRKDRFFIDPTIVVQWAIAHTDGGAEQELASYLHMVSPTLLRRWREGSARGGESGEQRLSAAEYAEAKRSAEGWVTFIGEAHKRDIRILTGTDTPVEWVIPGHSVHQELAFFVRAGMTPVEAIRCSTGRAAEAFRTPERGTIASGQVADLVIARGNVAADIRNIGQIETVILRGQIHARDELLEQARRLAALTPSD